MSSESVLEAACTGDAVVHQCLAAVVPLLNQSVAHTQPLAPDRRAAILERVGDESIGTVLPYKVAPGTYDVKVQSPPWRRFTGSEKTFSLKIEPCRRYYINAQFDNRVAPDWTPVIDHVETIAGCRMPTG